MSDVNQLIRTHARQVFLVKRVGRAHQLLIFNELRLVLCSAPPINGQAIHRIARLGVAYYVSNCAIIVRICGENARNLMMIIGLTRLN